MKHNETQNPKKKGSIWIIAGLLLIAAALLLTAGNLYEQNRAQTAAQRTLAQLTPQTQTVSQPQVSAQPIADEPRYTEPDLPDYRLAPKMEMPAQTVDDVRYIGVLEIPALELELPVAEEWSYETLELAPCRYSGSAYQDDLVICGHNYPAHFGLLRTLGQGDRVYFTDMDGNVFTYAVLELEALSATDVQDMQIGDWELTLFTCAVGGQSRIAVRCERLSPA